MSSEPIQPDANEPSPRDGVDLTTGSIPRHLIAFSIPMLIGNVLQTAYSIVSAIWVGQGLGTTALAAITVSFPVFFVLMAVANGLAMAANILSAQAYGAKDWGQLRRVIRNSVVLTLITSLMCVVVGYYAAEWLLRLMNTPSEVLPLAASYLRIFLWTMPAMFGVFLIASILRGTGDSKTPLYFQAVFVGLTVIITPVLMFGWLGFPRMGLNGAAVATIITTTTALAAVIVYLRRKRHIAALDMQSFKLDWATSWLMLRIGVPSMIQQALVSIGMLVVVSLVNGFGEAGAAAYGAAMRIDMLAFMPAMTVGMAVSTLAGQNIGATHFHRVNDVFKWGLILGGGITILASALALSVPGILLRMFIQDAEVIAIGTKYLRIVGSAYVLFAVLFVSNGVINGAGHTFMTTIFSLISLWIVRVPLAAYLSSSMGRIEGIWIAMVISFAVGSSVSVAYYSSGRWKRPVARKAPVEVFEQADSSPLPETRE